PAVIGEKKQGENELDADLDKYSAAISELASKNKLPLCDLRKIFRDYNLKNNTQHEGKNSLTYDGVHLNDKGNKLVAEQLLLLL
ncbi:MAG: G-D-S-L family lipolytic protein, partial [Sphingobacteriaceae bacterium]|nr:G-D-S-L family lipolytic protein [Sphingobacteriaceae bacterium]